MNRFKADIDLQWPVRQMGGFTRLGSVYGHGEERTGKERESKTYLLGIVAGACLYVCRLSLFNFEKHAKAGSNIAKNDRETQKAIISPFHISLSMFELGPRRRDSLFLSQSNSSAP